MSKPLTGGSGSSGPLAESYVDGGEILIGKLVGTALGAFWLTVVSGWYAIVSAIVRVHISLITATSSAYASIINAVGGGGAETLRLGWASAFQAAVQADPLLAPLLLTLEVVVVSAIAIAVRRRLA